MKAIDDKIKTLMEENNARVKKVEELTQQIEAFKQGIAAVKEEHDFTRGQIVALQELKQDAAQEATSKKVSTKKAKKGRT